MTHRQFEAWRVWQAMEWNRPNRTDHHIMRVAYEVYSVLREPKPIAEFQAKFAAPGPPVSTKLATIAAKARWRGILGGRNRT